MRNLLEVSTVCGRAAKRSARSAVATTPSVAIALVKKLRRSDTAISHLQGFSTGISDLDLSLVHRMLLPPGTQRVCRQSRPSENRIVLTVKQDYRNAGISPLGAQKASFREGDFYRDVALSKHNHMKPICLCQQPDWQLAFCIPPSLAVNRLSPPYRNRLAASEKSTCPRPPKVWYRTSGRE